MVWPRVSEACLAEHDAEHFAASGSAQIGFEYVSSHHSTAV